MKHVYVYIAININHDSYECYRLLLELTLKITIISVGPKWVRLPKSQLIGRPRLYYKHRFKSVCVMCLRMYRIKTRNRRSVTHSERDDGVRQEA